MGAAFSGLLAIAVSACADDTKISTPTSSSASGSSTAASTTAAVPTSSISPAALAAVEKCDELLVSPKSITTVSGSDGAARLQAASEACMEAASLLDVAPAVGSPEEDLLFYTKLLGLDIPSAFFDVKANGSISPGATARLFDDVAQFQEALAAVRGA